MYVVASGHICKLNMYLFSKFTSYVCSLVARDEICRNDSRNSNVTACGHKTRFRIDPRQKKSQSCKFNM